MKRVFVYAAFHGYLPLENALQKLFNNVQEGIVDSE